MNERAWALGSKKPPPHFVLQSGGKYIYILIYLFSFSKEKRKWFDRTFDKPIALQHPPPPHSSTI